MNLKIAIALFIGVFIGAAILAALVFVSAPHLMITENTSQHDFETTVTTLIASAEGLGWKVPAVHRLHDSVGKAGIEVLPAAVVEVCNPKLAGRILADESSRVVTSMMPCRIGVYQREDGKVTVTRMNTGLVAKLFGGLVTTVMGEATTDSEAIISSVL